MIWIYIYLIILLAKRELRRCPVSQSWDRLSVSIAKDREWGSYLLVYAAFKFCFTCWFEMFRNVYMQLDILAVSLVYDSGLHLLTSGADIFMFVNSYFPGVRIRQAGYLSGSSAVCFIWKVSWKGLYKGVAVGTAKDWGSRFGTKLWCWPEGIPREWVVSLGSHYHHLRMGVEALPSSMLLVTWQSINTVMLQESDTSVLQLIFEFDTETLTSVAIESGSYEQPDYKKQMWWQLAYDVEHWACHHQEWTLPFSFPPLEQQKTWSVELSEFWPSLSGLQPTKGTFTDSGADLDSHAIKLNASRSHTNKQKGKSKSGRGGLEC